MPHLTADLPSGWLGEKSEKRTPCGPGDLAVLFRQAPYELSFNELGLKALMDGKPLSSEDIDLAYVGLSELGYKAKKGEASDAILKVAFEKRFHPVRRYLESLRGRTDLPEIDIHTLAQKYLGLSAADATDANPKLRTALMGAVHRALNPGCKFDSCLVLHGDQGGGKSTFFKNLASPAWFCDTQLGSINKDLYIRMHSCWIYEIAELETFTTKREAGAVKGLLSSAEDRFRPPYGRLSDVFKRSGIFVASVNLDGFLVDRTGNRRFMVIRLPRKQGHKIPVHLAERDRDAIWRAFVLAYDVGIKPILNEAEQKANEETNQACLSEAAFEGPLGRWLAMNTVAQKEFTIDDCLHKSGARDLGHITETDKRKAGELLRSWGYDRKQKRVDRVRYWVWFKVSPLSHDTCHTRKKKDKKEEGVQ